MKPDNIMVTADGGIKILDFGLAHRMEGMNIDPEMSTASLIVPAGTPRYMSPEAYRGTELDARTDIFALGVVFYELICGLPPFRAQSWSELNDEILHLDPPPPCKNRKVSGRLSRLIMKMIEKEPDDRFASCDEVLTALRHAQRGDWPVRKFSRAALLLLAIPLIIFAPKISRSVLEILHPPIPSPTVLVVMPFTWLHGDRSEQMMARGLGELIGDELALHRKKDGYSVVRVTNHRDGPVRTIQDARSELGANLTVMGMIEQAGGGLQATLSLHRTNHSQTEIRSRSIAAPSGELRELAREGQITLHDMLGLEKFDEEIWRRVHGVRTEGPFRLYLKGIAWLHAGGDSLSIAEAILQFKRACQIDASYAAAHAALVQPLISAAPDGLIDGIERAELALARDPDLPAAWIARAAVQQEQDDIEGAIVTCTKVIEFPDAPLEAWFSLAKLLGRTDPAARIGIFDRAIESWPGWWQPYYRRGYWRYAGGTRGPALEDFQRMVNLAPERCSAWAYYGGLLVIEGQYEAGIDACKRALALRRDEAAFSNLATAYFNQRRFDEAIRTYQNAVQEGIDDYRLWLNIGDAYSGFDPVQARDAYLLAIEQANASDAPDQAITVADLARLHARIGDDVVAAELMESALNIDDAQMDVLESCALAAWDLGLHNRALSLLARAIEYGAPRTWIRDSALYDEWKQDPGFALVLDEGAS
jgi:tetratricopeptide (TPR) repeat protein